MVEYSAAKIQGLLSDGLDKSLSTTARGMALQNLFQYMLDGVPGLVTKANTIDPFQSEEIDIAVANTDPSNGLAPYPHVFLVECKNWDIPVDSPNVAAFIDKLENRYVDLGILVAANGITGNSDSLKSAQHKVALAQQRGRRVVVLDLRDLCAVRSSENLVMLLIDKLLMLVASSAFSGAPSCAH
jgi:hypothetical protein